MTVHAEETRDGPTRPWLILAGLVLFAAVVALDPPAGLSPEAWRVAAVACLMVVWWLGEAVPLPVTALVPIVALPLSGVTTLGGATAPYAHPLVFLFLGGFLLARALQRWDLHRRVALTILAAVGTRPAAIVGGFMIATAGLSMWVSNTATAVMMLPIGLSVIELLHTGSVGEKPSKAARTFAVALLLGIAYAASIGGAATLIGTPPNALMAAYLADEFAITIGFARWMAVGLPVALLMLLAAWLLMTRIVYRVGRDPIEGAAHIIARERAALGPMKATERRVLAVFGLVAGLWILRPLVVSVLPGLPLTDPAIAVGGAFLLFVVPSAPADRTDPARRAALLAWHDTAGVPWGVLILLGGGLSLAGAIGGSGLAQWIGNGLTTGAELPPFVLILIVAAAIVLLTELTSNTATAAVFLPVVAALAPSFELNVVALAATVALAASCAFMMPVATPPNAIVFASDRIRVPDMVRAGLFLNLVAIVAIAGAATLLVPLLFS